MVWVKVNPIFPEWSVEWSAKVIFVFSEEEKNRDSVVVCDQGTLICLSYLKNSELAGFLLSQKRKKFKKRRIHKYVNTSLQVSSYTRSDLQLHVFSTRRCQFFMSPKKGTELL